MSNHPDTHGDGLTEKEKDAMRDRFIEARMAFEMLVEDPEDGTAILVEEKEDRDGNFDSWFRNETGLKNPFDVDIDPETMKEVAEMTEKLGGSQGMDRDGGMWALARMVTSAVKSGGDAASILRLEAGDVKGPGPVPGGKLEDRDDGSRTDARSLLPSTPDCAVECVLERDARVCGSGTVCNDPIP
eukprot:CAMPEP_0172385332 /NCGR_PEP_ID=MMETSP1061-20121228/3003_1 /TAXON_ID=37318 /ORGANISM="Pseudo-nitzschia pungens, Strain cf. pungens" /LENGTH=185 /DNA_ID=CAMNT_0013114299 /DNA_START=696 /DNA_END=1254 /DNA_ORIENTATION=-